MEELRETMVNGFTDALGLDTINGERCLLCLQCDQCLQFPKCKHTLHSHCFYDLFSQLEPKAWTCPICDHATTYTYNYVNDEAIQVYDIDTDNFKEYIPKEEPYYIISIATHSTFHGLYLTKILFCKVICISEDEFKQISVPLFEGDGALRKNN